MRVLQVCLGLPHTPSHPIHLEQQKQLAEANDFKVRDWVVRLLPRKNATAVCKLAVLLLAVNPGDRAHLLTALHAA